MSPITTANDKNLTIIEKTSEMRRTPSCRY